MGAVVKRLHRNGKRKRVVNDDYLDVLTIVWLMHFKDLPPCEARCELCTDYKVGVCGGGKDPLECMEEKAAERIVVLGALFD